MKRVMDAPKEHIAEWIFRRIHGGKAPSVDGVLGLVDGTELIAGVAYTDYNGRSVGIHVAIEGNRRLSKEFIWAAFFYPFRELRVKKIIATIDSGNEKSLAFNANLGFVVECIIKDAGSKNDMVVASMTADQCKWLSMKCALNNGEQHA